MKIIVRAGVRLFHKPIDTGQRSLSAFYQRSVPAYD